LSRVGVQEPAIPLVEIVGNTANVAPEQIGEIGSNKGVIFGLTLIVNVVIVAQPEVGVKV
jgi:hypothetical protein